MGRPLLGAAGAAGGGMRGVSAGDDRASPLRAGVRAAGVAAAAAVNCARCEAGRMWSRLSGRIRIDRSQWTGSAVPPLLGVCIGHQVDEALSRW